MLKHHKTLLISLIFISLISFSSAELIIGQNSNNSKGVLINSKISSQSSGGSNANVSSVSSGDGCIFVSPTTGDVIVTFNSSCGAGGGISSSTLNTTYLKLDASNDPLTGDLDIKKAAPVLNLSSTSGIGKIILETAAGLSQGVWSFRQATVGTNLEIYWNAFRVLGLTSGGTVQAENITIVSTASVPNVRSPTSDINASSNLTIDDTYSLRLRGQDCYLFSPAGGEARLVCLYNISITGSQITLTSLNNTINGNVTIPGVGNNFVVDTNDYAFISRLLPKVGLTFKGGATPGITITGSTGYDQLRIDPILNQTILNTPLYTDTNGTVVPLPGAGQNTTVFTVDGALLNKFAFMRKNVAATLLGAGLFGGNGTASVLYHYFGTGSLDKGNVNHTNGTAAIETSFESGSSEYYNIYFRSHPRETPPFTCTKAKEGYQFYNNDTGFNEQCFCNSTSWVTMHTQAYCFVVNP